MSGDKKEEPNVVLGSDWFEKNDLPFSGKRATVVAVYYSFPSNQNASGSSGTNLISQKIIPWGHDAQPRIYVSPFALKRRIRDYWIKSGEDVILREDKVLSEANASNKDLRGIDFIDYDLFGYMKDQGKGKVANTRPGPVTTWGAVSLEPYHSFVDFNTNLISTTNSESGGSIINRSISPELYFTSFAINPDMVGLDFTDPDDKEQILKRKRERLKLFFEALKYAMQKDVGGARDKPACVFMAIAIGDYGYPSLDKQLFAQMKVINNEDGSKKLEISNLPNGVKVLCLDDSIVEDISLDKDGDISKVVEELITKSNKEEE